MFNLNAIYSKVDDQCLHWIYLISSGFLARAMQSFFILICSVFLDKILFRNLNHEIIKELV
jgi:hypothetical protein